MSAVSGIRLAVAWRTDLISSGVSVGRFCSSSAATPATCGLAMLVPDADAVPPGSDVTSTPVVPVETMLSPGAVTAGW